MNDIIIERPSDAPAEDTRARNKGIVFAALAAEMQRRDLPRVGRVWERRHGANLSSQM